MLEVAVGIIFVFILVSLICSAIKEGIEAWLKTRAAYLEHGIRDLLNDKKGVGLAKNIYEHPLIYSLFSDSYTPGKDSKRPSKLAKGGNLPSYIPSKNFALALMDIAARGPETDEVSSHPSAPVISLESIRMNIMNLGNPFVQRALLTAIDSAQGNLNKAQENIEKWYDSVMDRVSGWYKRSTQTILFFIGLAVAVMLNVNIITIGDYLFRNDAARAVIVKRAEEAAKDTAINSRSYNQAKQDLEALNLPIGWSIGWGAPQPSIKSRPVEAWNDIFGPLLGWLITALAAMLGAPFWFDVLNKIMVIRSTVKPHEKSPEESSEDRQVSNRRQQIVDRPIQAQEVLPNTQVAAGMSAGSPPPLASTGVYNYRDKASSIDGCEVDIVDFTPDEQLPQAEGGVA